ncbi:hypothetical protein DH2020_039514 [Rehmannia glutinosa]|uniref:Aminotransferase-like plant mobile domain-containing protein n=1 Tax=Rehmannia glutinosa TaxID=99300 RepID=A0ABR0UVM5_REHGL
MKPILMYGKETLIFVEVTVIVLEESPFSFSSSCWQDLLGLSKPFLIMVFFKDDSLPSGVQHLMILDDESQSIDKGTILAVFDPVVGRYATAWPRLTNPSYLEEWSKEIPSSKTFKTWTLQATHHQQSAESTPLPTLGCHIIEGQAKWGDDIKFAGELHYIEGYWEWTEDVLSRCKNSLQKVKIYDAVYASLFTYDNNSNIMRAFCEAWCPSMNTLLTSFGELSISLWDLHTLAGLPITGSLYDEVDPCAKELTGLDEATKKKRVARPKSTYNPLGNLDVHGEWTPTDKASFSKINIKESLREETYLAAFLACWLCVFVLPNDDINMIRPSTFKMAGSMASGRTIGLAIPILASIYKGLNKIAGSSRPSRVCSTFPFHFVHGWLAHYFKTHHQVWQGVRGPKMMTFSGEGGAKYYDPSDARKRIHKGELVSLTCTMITKEKDFTYVDNGNAEEFERNYFLAIRSNYLLLRQDEGIHYWRLCTLSKTFSKVCLPCMPPNAKKFSSEDYKTWWNKVHECFFQENIASLINMERSGELPGGTKPNNGGGLIDENSQASSHVAPLANECNAQANKRKSTSHPAEESSSNADRHWKRPKRDSGSLPSHDVDDIAYHPLQIETFSEELEKDLVNNDDDESQGSQRSVVRLNELARNSMVDKTTREETSDLAKATKTPHCAAFSVFEGGKLLYKHQREFLQNMWSDLREKLANTSIDFISSIKEDVFVVLESMKSFKDFDISHLEELLKAFFAQATAYDDARSISSEKGSKELLARQLSEARDRLHDAKTKENKEFAQIMSTKDDLESIKKEIDDLRKRKKNLIASLKQQQELLQIAQVKFLILKRRLLAPSRVFPHRVMKRLKT